MGFWKTLLDFGKKALDKASIAISAYSIGDAKNDGEKVKNAVIEATRLLAKDATVNNDHDISVITYMFVFLIIAFCVIGAILLSKCCTKRAVRSERQVIWSELKAKMSKAGEHGDK